MALTRPVTVATPKPLILDEGDGLAAVELRTAAGPVSVTLDLYEAHDAYLGLCRQHPDDAAALGAAWVGWLAEKGLPGLSVGAAFRVVERVFDGVAAFKKKHSPPPASPGSSASPSSD